MNIFSFLTSPLFFLLQQALHIAALGGHLDTISLLLNDPRVDPNAKDKDGYTGKERSQSKYMNIFSFLFFDISFSFNKHFIMLLQVDI